MLNTVFFAILCLIPAITFAGNLKQEADAQALADRVMTDVAAGEIIKGIEHLRAFNVYSKDEFEASLTRIKAQLPDIDKRFGPTVGYDFVTVEKVADTLRQYVYLQKFEKHVLVWRFIFYKPRDHWLLNTFYFDDKVQMLFVY